MTLPDILALDDLGDGVYSAPHPADDPEGRNIVFSGQLMAQMIMAADRSVDSAHDVKSLHTVFSRAGTYDHPMQLRLDTTHAGRLFGSTTITAMQNDRLLSRGMALLNNYEADFLRHAVVAPDVPGPDSVAPDEHAHGFPGAESRTVLDGSSVGRDGTPRLAFWTRMPEGSDSVAANQAMLAWAQPGDLIGLAFKAHPGAVSIDDVHVTLSTGVIAHTVHFHERFDVGEWLLIEEWTTAVGHGRIAGEGRVFDQAGKLVSTFSQDSMARTADRPLDPNRSM